MDWWGLRIPEKKRRRQRGTLTLGTGVAGTFEGIFAAQGRQGLCRTAERGGGISGREREEPVG